VAAEICPNNDQISAEFNPNQCDIGADSQTEEIERHPKWFY
jgi:hypothetical protein